MLMAVFERVREIGMMRALGMKDGDIRLAFLFESAGIGLIGSVMGIALGILLNIWLVNWGINFGWLLRDFDFGYRMSTMLRGAWDFATIFVAFAAGIVLSMIVAFIPAHRALKMTIPDCLRHQ